MKRWRVAGVVVLSIKLGVAGAGAKAGDDETGTTRGNNRKNKEARQVEREKNKEEREAKKEENQNKMSEKREGVVDARETRQGKRIQHGINKGYLTEDEVKKLQTQQDSIAALEASVKADGKMTGGDFRQLQQALNTASHCIWAEKHDTDGNQMPTYRLGKTVFAKSNLTTALANENLSNADAKALLKDFHRTVELKRKLSTGDLSAEQRAKLQDEYDELLNKYFEVK